MSIPADSLDWLALCARLAPAPLPAPWWAVPLATLLVGVATVVVAIYSIRVSSKNARAGVAAAGVIAQAQIDTATANARRQTQASVISSARQRWIDAIRDDVSALLSADLAYRTSDAGANKPGTPGWAAMSANLHELYRLRSRLELRLNPTKPLHIALTQAIEALMNSDGDDKLARAVAGAAKILLKEEWERVKREATGDFPLSAASENDAPEPATTARPPLAEPAQ
jgi:hypothetical protein